MGASNLAIMFSELKALVALAETGSMERAASKLYLTASAFTRRIQRLEAELDLVLVDRHFKPPKLTQAGFQVLERSRAILASVGELKAAVSGDNCPTGPFRLGLSHALAQPEISKVVIDLAKQFPSIQPSISNDISWQLLTQVRLGDLDCALVVFPAETPFPRDLDAVVLSHEAVAVIASRRSSHRSESDEFYRRNWIVNPAGCLVREEVKSRVERLGASFAIAAELHNPDLQLSLIAGNMGVGIARAKVLRMHRLRHQLRIIEHPKFNIPIKIAFVRKRHLGTREHVAITVQRMLAEHFECSH